MILNLVNFAVTPYVSREGVLFETSEHNYQYLKAVYFQAATLLQSNHVEKI